MALTTGCNHVALVTEDLDRLLAFWGEVFDAEVVFDLVEGPLRHAMLDLGAGFRLHPFEFADGHPDGRAGEAMFGRGHLDHLAVNVPDEEAFELLRKRLVECGASDGEVTDFGLVRVMTFRDPDGMTCEIARWVDGEILTLEDSRAEPWVAA